MKLHYCFLERFNNYFNRKIIKYGTLLEYQNNSKSFFIPEDTHGAMMPFDFNPNDNVMTEIIANEVPFDPDYFLLLDDDSNIVQRWFVLEQKRNRQGQWVYTLRRDVISDNLENLSDSPIFVQKGMLPDDDPMIFNNEGMIFNQIKKNEVVLKDLSKSSWVMCYLAKNLISADVTVDVPAETDIGEFYTLTDIASELGISEAVLVSHMNLNPNDNNVLKLTNSLNLTYYTSEIVDSYRSTMGISSDFLSTYGGSNTRIYTDVSSYYLFIPRVLGEFATKIRANASALLGQMTTVMQRDYYLQNNIASTIINKYNGKYIYYLGKYYKFNVYNTGTTSTSKTFNSATNSAWDTACQETADASGGAIYYSRSTGRITLQTNDTNYQLSLIDASELNQTYQLVVNSGRKPCLNQEFDLVAIPASDISVVTSGGQIEQSGALAQRVASALGIKEGTNIYDIQLLPYCPRPEIISSENKIDITGLTVNKDYNLIFQTGGGSGTLPYEIDQNSAILKVGNHITHRAQICGKFNIPSDSTLSFDNIVSDADIGSGAITNLSITQDDTDILIEFDLDPLANEWNISCDIEWTTTDDIQVGVAIYVQDASFITQIPYSITLTDSMKIDSQCDFYRLVSPNYQGSFDFNVAKNGGSVEFFSVYCTCKPYTPFIKVTPNLKYVYGSDYNDNRGLICGGDFSLPRASSAWEQYQLENKNYQNIFNREIQHLDFMQSIEMRNQLVSGAVQTVSDTAKGAGAGAYVGGGWGALIGGAVGLSASLIGYGIDTDTLARTQREQRQLAIDKFNYQLGNIQALPYTLTKVGAFDVSSKIFPILEYYTCTDKEKQALKDKIKWESMTVMRIGTLNEFMNFNGEKNYFKGELIRNDVIADDPHTFNAIYEELLKGVYI